MKPPFFSRRVRLFGNVAILILCVVFFLIPFEFRGARMSLGRMKNDVKDWLPTDFPETEDLDWFREHFLGEQFVLVTWPGCTADDPRLAMLVEKVRNEIAPDQGTAPADEDPDAAKPAGPQPADLPQRDKRALALEKERLRVAAKADELGLHKVQNDYYYNWGGREEKWLKGNDRKWYFITPDGKLYCWKGRNNLLGFLVRSASRATGKRSADGIYVDTFGGGDAAEYPNKYHAEPRLLTSRFFKQITTGPEVLQQLTEKGGPLWPRGSDDDQAKATQARQLAYQRLTGALFGPVLPDGFGWTSQECLRTIGSAKQRQLPKDWEAQFDRYVDQLVTVQYDGDRQKLLDENAAQAEEHWNAFFTTALKDPQSGEPLKISPPARQTCALIILSDVGKKDLARVVGRNIMGKPLGRLRDIAANECGIATADLKLGGPPIDNVSIDEEGTITLQRLVLWCAIIGLGLALICFRSLKVTFMVFFVGSVSAVTSLGIVWWSGSAVDTILLSMPALIYVLGLSGAVHIVNYYRDAAEHDGEERAAETALRHGWFPCTLAAFTTSLGLVSLCTSHLVPIWKFGFFSAVGVMATLVLLFTYLPSALTIWAPGYKKIEPGQQRKQESGLKKWISSFWERVGRWVIRRHGWVTVGCLALLLAVGLGLFKIRTSVQLLKLFDADSQIISDYRWIEGSLGNIIPMELVVRVAPEEMRPPLSELGNDAEPTEKINPAELAKLKSSTGSPAANNQLRIQHVHEVLLGRQPSEDEVRFGQAYLGESPDADRCEEYRDLVYIRSLQLQYSFLERLEIAARVQHVVEQEFGRAGSGDVGQGMSAATFAPQLPGPDSGTSSVRPAYTKMLEDRRADFLASDNLRIDKKDQSELWRISLRLGALNDVDYGLFVSDLSQAVEPVLTAYRMRKRIYQQVENARELEQLKDGNWDVVILGGQDTAQATTGAARRSGKPIDQTKIFAEALTPLLINDGYNVRSVKLNEGEPLPDWAQTLNKADCVVVLDENPSFSLENLSQHASIVFDASGHHFTPDSDRTNIAFRQGENISVVYTGVVPVVYKAQRTLLNSLINSIGWAFVTIGLVMMILLRDWKSPARLGNIINTRGGFVSMIPNVFPVVMIFGAMGHMGVLIDIGTMMTASVAMGIAVDDTIHFLSWFRYGLREGLSRQGAIMQAYRRVATAMTQTTAIGGLGLAIFALSTFTPTQRFGVMMLVLLVAALVGDLILLPALLAGPLGRFFEVAKADKKPPSEQSRQPREPHALEKSGAPKTPHSAAVSEQSKITASQHLRTDSGHT